MKGKIFTVIKVDGQLPTEFIDILLDHKVSDIINFGDIHDLDTIAKYKVINIENSFNILSSGRYYKRTITIEKA